MLAMLPDMFSSFDNSSDYSTKYFFVATARPSKGKIGNWKDLRNIGPTLIGEGRPVTWQEELSTTLEQIFSFGAENYKTQPGIRPPVIP